MAELTVMDYLGEPIAYRPKLAAFFMSIPAAVLFQYMLERQENVDRLSGEVAGVRISIKELSSIAGHATWAATEGIRALKSHKEFIDMTFTDAGILLVKIDRPAFERAAIKWLDECTRGVERIETEE